MKTRMLCPVLMLAAATLLAADSNPKDDVTAAAKKLAAADNFSWTTTSESSGPFNPGPTEGKMQKDGLMTITFNFNDNSIQSVVKGGKGAIKTEDGWKSLDEAGKDDGGGGFNPTRFLVRRLQNFKSPADEAADTASKAKDLKNSDGVIAGDLTEDQAKELLTFRRRGNGGDGPNIKNAKASAKFWVKDGMLTKYQVHVSGSVEFNGNDNDVDRTTTTEFKDVGATKVTVPDDAKSKMGS